METFEQSPSRQADVLARGFGVPPLDSEPVAVPPGSVCVARGHGEPLTHGYPVSFVYGNTTTNPLDEVADPNGYVCDALARCRRYGRPGSPVHRSLLAFADGTAWNPLIARGSATAERPAWSDLVRAVWPKRAGQTVVAIFSTDTKKRVWQRTTAGPLGHATPAYLYGQPCGAAPRYATPLRLDWPALLDCLTLLEEVYALGVSKDALWRCVASPGGGASHAQGPDLATLLQYERAVQPWRTRAEFPVALLIAQKPAELPAEDAGEDTDCDDA